MPSSRPHRTPSSLQPGTSCAYKIMPNEETQDEPLDATKNRSVRLAVEGDGSLPVDEIITEAARIMREKCERVVDELTG